MSIDEPPSIPTDPISICAELPALRTDEGGVIRVGQSRVSFDLLVERYENGLAPEEMVRAYDTLALADVYSAIAFYLRHRDEVRMYLQQRAEQAAALRATIETERRVVTRGDLLARLSAAEQKHAATGP